MEATIIQDYRGIDIIVNAVDTEFGMLTIDELKSCINAEVEKRTRMDCHYRQSTYIM